MYCDYIVSWGTLRIPPLLGKRKKSPETVFTCQFTTLGFVPRMKWSVITLFGRVMNNNVELCSDLLFHSAAQCWALLGLHSAAHFSSSHSRKETQGKYIFQYFLTQLYHWVIILYIKWGHQGAHPLHSLEHNIYFHDLPFSPLSSLVSSSQYLQNFWWFGCAGSAGGWHRTWTGICKCWGRNY